MSLSPGTRLGSYEILAPIGAGGMGEVYRARDTNLDRDVAIKVLPSALAQDPERLARFEREAKVLAALNHPNIAQIYGIEQGALVMEMVEGENLSGPLARCRQNHLMLRFEGVSRVPSNLARRLLFSRLLKVLGLLPRPESIPGRG
jgi:serine/threonine protein kinase